MKLACLLAATAALALGACDSGGGGEAAKPAAEKPAAAAPAPKPAPAPAAIGIPGMTAAFATEAEWIASCTSGEPKIPESVCTCVSKAAVKEVGVKGLYTWIWEGYVNRNSIAVGRSKKWFTENGLDSAAQQKFADAVGKCYATQ